MLTQYQWDLFRAIERPLRDAHFNARLVGGAVRDHLLGSVPSDMDFCTPAHPEHAAEIFEAAGMRVLRTGISHGTITVVCDAGIAEVTTLRVDEETDGRHAKVRFTPLWELDAARRDFTINAMSMDSDGTVYDYFRGREDLSLGCVRFVGNPTDRIEEDHLRIMRYWRFLARMRVKHGQRETWQTLALDSHCTVIESPHLLETVSGERIWSELRKILQYGDMSTILEMVNTGVFRSIGMHLNSRSASAISEIIRVLVEGFTGNDPLPVFAAMLHDTEEVDRMKERLHLSNAEVGALKYIISMDGATPTRSWLVERLVRDDHRSNIQSFLRYTGDTGLLAALTTLTEDRLPKFPLTGRDIMDTGVPSGPAVGRMLDRAFELWIDSAYQHDRDTLIACCRESTPASQG